MSYVYSDQFPLLSEVTNNFDSRLLKFVGENLSTFSLDLQVEYKIYRQYQQEYEDWLDSNTTPNFVHDY